MKEVPLDKPSLDTDKILFHITTLRDAIPGAPQGIWIENTLMSTPRLLREREKNGVLFRFFTQESGNSILDRISLQVMPGTTAFGNYVGVDLYAEVLQEKSERITLLINQAMETKADPVELTDFVQDMLRDAYELTCEFINILRHDYGQYWLRPPLNLFDWAWVCYYCESRQQWFSICARDDFAPSLLQRDWETESETTWQPFSLIKVIGEDDLPAMATAKPAPEPTFADDMISTALIELKQNRYRSAIVHAIIAYEAAAKIGLEILLKGRLKGLDSANIVKAICREVSTVRLGQAVIGLTFMGNTKPSLDWSKIEALYNTRNTIIHRRQRRLPAFREIREQVVEVYSYVTCLQNALRNMQPE